MVHWFLGECRENCRGFVKLQYIFERAIKISRENFCVLSKIRENRESFVPWRIVVYGILISYLLIQSLHINSYNMKHVMSLSAKLFKRPAMVRHSSTKLFTCTYNESSKALGDC